MAQIAVTIIDPSNNRSAHLVETRLRERELIPQLVSALRLSSRASYQLFLMGNENALPVDNTLAENGVPAGAELQIRPVRNHVLKMILDKLYEEAQGYIEEQAWTLAQEKLQEIWRTDPSYPDPLELRKAVSTRTPPLQSAPPRPQNTQPIGTRRSPAATASRTGSLPVPPRPLAAPPANANVADAYQLGPQAVKSSGLSCLFISLMAAGVVLAAGVALVVLPLVLPGFLSGLPRLPGFALPSTPALGTGDVQVTLRWESEADLDLHVIDPNGEEIWFAHPESSSGGILDVDANGACEGASRPVENIYWPTGDAPPGTYSVVVVYFQTCALTRPTEYEVTVTVDGEVQDVIHAQINTEGEEHPVTNFEY